MWVREVNIYFLTSIEFYYFNYYFFLISVV